MLDVPWIMFRLVALLRSLRPDLVQTWMYHADLLGGVAARLAGVRKLIWGIRATELPHEGPTATRVIRWLCARLSGWLPQAIVCAANASREAHVRLGYEPSKMLVIPNGYDFSKLASSSTERAALRAHVCIAEDALVVGTLGRFHPDKDQQNFVCAAGIVGRKYATLRFLMVGRGLDWDNTQLVEWINATGLKERFVLMGERNDVPVCLSAMDIFCLPSRSEAFPNVLVEAMAMGLPCVATNVGDVAALLQGGGELVDKENSPAFASGIQRLQAKGAAARRQIGAENQKRVRGEYSIDRTSERFDAVYKSLLDQTGGT